MQFSTTNHFNASAAHVAEALRDPDFYESLDALPDMATPEVVSNTVAANATILVVRYRYTGNVDGFVRRMVGNEPLAWLQHTSFDHDSNNATIKIETEVAKELLRCSGTMKLDGAKKTSTRVIDASLDVRIPLISGRVANSLIPGIIARIDAEADALGDWLTR